MLLLKLFLAANILVTAACATNFAWVAEKKGMGGTIGYGDADFFGNRKKAIADFNRAASEICGHRKWVITKERIPAPTDIVSASRNAASGNAGGAFDAGARAFTNDQYFRSKRKNKEVKVEYGDPFKSWNEADIECR